MNGRHRLAGLSRQAVFGRLGGDEDVNDADRLCRDPAMRWVVGDRAISGSAASAGQMGRFKTGWPSQPENLVALADLPGQWIDTVHRRRRPKSIVLDMDSSESPTYGEHQGSAYNVHFACTCYHSLREKLFKIGAKVVGHGRYVTFQIAEVAVSCRMFAEILSLIARMRAPPGPA